MKTNFITYMVYLLCPVYGLLYAVAEPYPQVKLIPEHSTLYRASSDFQQVELQRNLDIAIEKHKPIINQPYTNMGNIDPNTIELTIGDQLMLAGPAGITHLLPGHISKQVWLWQRSGLKNYKSILRRIRSMNPVPGFSYFFRSKHPSYPLIYIRSIDIRAFELGTEPYLEDYRLRNKEPVQNTFGFGIRFFIY